MKAAGESPLVPLIQTDLKAKEREQVFAQAVAQHEKGLLSVVNRLLKNKAEAEEITQEVFIEFLTAYDLEKAIESLGSWLFAVARNKVLDRFRKKKSESIYRVASAAALPGESVSVSRPDEVWISQRLRNQITEALDMLPPEQRDVFVKHELEGKSFQEISTETGVSVNTLLSRKRYALIFLRNQLKETYDELE